MSNAGINDDKVQRTKILNASYGYYGALHLLFRQGKSLSTNITGALHLAPAI
jgi:hypothetical protein